MCKRSGGKRNFIIKYDSAVVSCLLCLLTIFEPEMLVLIKPIHFVFTAFRVLLLLWCFLTWVKSRCIPKIIIACLPYYMVLCGSIWLNRTSWMSFLPDLIVILLVQGYGALQIVVRPLALIKALYYLFWIYMVINEIYILFNLSELSAGLVSFLGGKNSFGPIAICAILVGLLQKYLFREKDKGAYYLIALTIFENLQLGSSAGIIGIFVFCMTLTIMVRRKYRLRIFKLYLFTYIVAIWMIVFVRIQDRFSSMIYELTGKDATFTARTVLWDLAIRLIRNRLWLGYGQSNVIGRYNVQTNDIAFWAAHNGILDLLLVGGIPLLFAYCFYLLYCAHQAEKNGGYVSQCCMAGWFSFSILLLVEYYEMSRYFVLITLFMVYSESLEKLKDELRCEGE